MIGVPGIKITQQGIFAVRRAAADLVARIEVAQDDRHAFAFEVAIDLFAQKQANILELYVTRSIAL